MGSEHSKAGKIYQSFPIIRNGQIRSAEDVNKKKYTTTNQDIDTDTMPTSYDEAIAEDEASAQAEEQPASKKAQKRAARNERRRQRKDGEFDWERTEMDEVAPDSDVEKELVVVKVEDKWPLADRYSGGPHCPTGPSGGQGSGGGVSSGGSSSSGGGCSFGTTQIGKGQSFGGGNTSGGGDDGDE